MLAYERSPGLQSSLTHSDRLRDEPLDAGATSEANHFEKVPILAKTPRKHRGFREMSDQLANLMELVILNLLCGVSG